MSSVQILYKRSLELFMQYFKVIVNCYMDSFGHVLCKCCPNIVSAKYCANIVPIMCKYCVNIVQILCKCADYFYWVNLRGRCIYTNRCIKMDILYVSTSTEESSWMNNDIFWAKNFNQMFWITFGPHSWTKFVLD